MDAYNNIYNVRKFAIGYLEEKSKIQKQSICNDFINMLVDRQYTKLSDEAKLKYCDKVAKTYIYNCNKMFQYG